MTTNVGNPKILGLVLTVLSLCVCIKGENEYIISGIILALIHSILIFGAFMRNTKIILLWMVLAILNLCYMIFAFMIILGRMNSHRITQTKEKNEIEIEWENGGIIVGTYVIYVGIIVLIVWTFIVAISTRTKILEEQQHRQSMIGQSVIGIMAAGQVMIGHKGPKASRSET